MRGDHPLYFGVTAAVAKFRHQLAHSIVSDGLFIEPYPSLMAFLFFQIVKRVMRRPRVDITAPMFGREAGAKTFLRAAQCDVKRIALQLFQDRLCFNSFGIEQIVRGNTAQTGFGAIHPHTPTRVAANPPFDPRPRFARHVGRFAKQPRFRLFEININEHHPRRVKHECAVSVAGDDRLGVDRFDDLLTQRLASP